MNIRYIVLLGLFVFLAGCITQPEKLGCCSPEAASRGICDFQGEFSSQLAPFTQNPNDPRVIQGGCDDKDLTCKVTFVLENNVRKDYQIPICNSEQTMCVSGDCLTQVCSPFVYDPTVQPSMRDLESFRTSTKITSTPFSRSIKSENLLNTSCLVLPMNDQLGTFFKNSKGSFVNIFRFGIGSTFADFESYRFLFPISDYFCNINANVPNAKDRFMNYLLGQNDYRAKENAFLANQPYAFAPELIASASAFCPQNGQSPFVSSSLGGPQTPSYKSNEVVTTSHFVEPRQGQNGEVSYQQTGVAPVSSYTAVDKDFYASALRLEYKSELQAGLLQNPPTPAPFECEGAFGCQSGYCSFDTYYRGLCQKADDSWVECGCSESLRNCAGKTATPLPPGNVNIEQFARDFNSNPDANNYMPQQLDTWFFSASMNPSCDLYTVDGWETKDKNIIDDLCILHGNNEYECGDYSNEDKFLLSCTLQNADAGTYACTPTSNEDHGAYRNCVYNSNTKAITCAVQTVLEATPCVEQNGAFACGPNPDNPSYLCQGGVCSHGEAQYPGCQVDAQGMNCQVNDPIRYPGCVPKEGADNTILCGSKTVSTLQTSVRSPLNEAFFPRDVQFFGKQVADPYSWQGAEEDPNGDYYIGFSLLPSREPATYPSDLSHISGSVYSKWEEEIRQEKQQAVFENTQLATQCNLQHRRDYIVTRGPNQAGYSAMTPDPLVPPVQPDPRLDIIRNIESNARTCNDDPFGGWRTDAKLLSQSCFFRAPLVVREGTGVNYGSENVGTPECNTFDDDYAEFYFTPEYVLLKAHQNVQGENEPWYLGDCKLDKNFVPVTKTFGWCEGCSMLTSAYQTVETQDDPYKIDSTKRVFSNDFSIPKTTEPTEVFVQGSGYNYYNVPESTLLRARLVDTQPVDPQFQYYGSKNTLYFSSFPPANYLQEKQADYLRSGVLPIIDATSPSNWDGDHNHLFDSIMPEGPSIVIVDSLSFADANNPAKVEEIKDRIDSLTQGDIPVTRKAQFAIRLDDAPIDSETGAERLLRGIAMLDNLHDHDPVCAGQGEGACIFSSSYVTTFVYPFSADESLLDPQVHCDGNFAAQTSVNYMGQLSGYGLRNYGLLSYIDDLHVNYNNPCWTNYNQGGVEINPIRSFYSTIFARQVTLSKAGIMGVQVKDSQPFVRDNNQDYTSYFCSVTESSSSLAAEIPLTVIQKAYAKSEDEPVVCQECSPYDLSCGEPGTPALDCSDGSTCVPPAGGFDPAKTYKCPDFTVSNECNLCTDFDSPLTCTRQYSDGSTQKIKYAGQNSVGSIVSSQGDIIPDIIAAIPKGNQCCLLDAQGQKYSYFNQVSQGSVRAPMVFTRNQNSEVDCGVPDFGATADQFVCSQASSPIKNYFLSCKIE